MTEPEHPGPAELAGQRDDVTGIRHRRDPREVVGERADAERLDGRLVHEARVEVADLGRDGARLGGAGRDLLDDRAHVLLGGLAQHVEGAVAAAVLGDLRRREPPAVDVCEQVVLGPDVGVDGGGVDTGSHGRWLLAGRRPPIEPHRPPGVPRSGRTSRPLERVAAAPPARSAADADRLGVTRGLDGRLSGRPGSWRSRIESRTSSPRSVSTSRPCTPRGHGDERHHHEGEAEADEHAEHDGDHAPRVSPRRAGDQIDTPAPHN